MPPTSQLIPPGTPSPQPTEEIHPLDRLILQILQQAQTAPIQPPPVEQFGTGRKIALALASLDPQYRKERIDPLIQQRQAAAQFNPELERLKLLHGIIGPLGPVLSSMQRSETKLPPANTVTPENIAGRLIEVTRDRYGTELSRRDVGRAGTPPPSETTVQVYDPAGNAYFVPKPRTIKSPQAIDLPGGQQAAKPIPLGTDVQIQTSINSLNIAKQTIAEMRQNYERGVAEHNIPSRIGASGAMGIPGIRTIAGYAGSLGAGGRLHDAKRRLLVLELQKSITGQNRVLESILQGITEAIPPYAENPEVARPLYDSLEQMADAGLQTYLSVRHNPGAADVAAGATRQAKKRIRRSNFNQLPDAEKQRALRDGVEVID